MAIHSTLLAKSHPQVSANGLLGICAVAGLLDWHTNQDSLLPKNLWLAIVPPHHPKIAGSSRLERDYDWQGIEIENNQQVQVLDRLL
jgi:hypothetical protein